MMYTIMNVMNKTNLYRIEALLALSAAFPGARRANDIARRRAVPEPFLARLLAELARAGLVVTSRGPAGGARLARPPADISLLEVLPRPERTTSGGAGAQWLESRLAEAQRQALAGINLAALLAAEQAASATADFEI
jgi:Rrf2 family protein